VEIRYIRPTSRLRRSIAPQAVIADIPINVNDRRLIFISEREDLAVVYLRQLINTPKEGNPIANNPYSI
jgi:hypothetical protein